MSRRHRLFAVCAVLAMWLAQPALAALCPCLSVTSVATAEPTASLEKGGATSCCTHCCQPPSEDQSSKITTPFAAYCSALDASLFHQGATLEAGSPSKPGGEFQAVESIKSFGLGLQLAWRESPDMDAPLPGVHPPRTLALTVARRCHPGNAPPLV